MIDETGDQVQAPGAEEIRHLRERARLVPLLKQRLAEANRNTALRESNVDWDHPTGRLLRKTLEQSESWSDGFTPEEVRSTAETYGVPIRKGSEPT